MLIKIVIVYLIIINVLTFLLYGIDKWKAKADQWRVSEKTLLLTALIGGSVGALIGMQLFRHKTQHWKFRILVPVFLILHVALAVYAVYSGWITGAA